MFTFGFIIGFILVVAGFYALKLIFNAIVWLFAALSVGADLMKNYKED